MQSLPAERSLFLLLLTYVKPLDEVDRLLVPHRSYLDRHYTAGHFLISGRQEPRTGGVILAQAENREQIHLIIAEDPFLTEGRSGRVSHCGVSPFSVCLGFRATPLKII